MTNNEIVQARLVEMIAKLRAAAEAAGLEVEDAPVVSGFYCDGCNRVFNLENDFTFWKLGPPDFCPSCWS